MAHERLSHRKPHRPRSRRHGYSGQKVYADLGSVSSATMRSEDLIPAFQSMLEELAAASGDTSDLRFCEEINEHYDAAENASEDYYSTEEADYDLEELFDRLGEYAPPGTFFGGHPGDPADYGFWIYENLEREWDDLKVEDVDEIPSSYEGFVLAVGTEEYGYEQPQAMYEQRGGKLKLIWTIA